MRLIDADELKNKLRTEQRWIVKRDGYTNEGFSYDQVMFTIDKIPTVDVVGVIRCKDCANYHNSGEAEGIGWCDIHSRIDALGEWDIWHENDFCSSGERKEE